MSDPMSDEAPAVCVHHTAHRHIDDVAVGSAFTAIAASSLTGDVWDGALTLLSNIDGAEATVSRVVPTRGGNAGLAWVNAEVLATGDDRGDLTIWQVLAPTGAEAGAAMTPLASFGEHSQPVTAVTATSSGEARVASSSLDGTAKVWAAVVAGGATATLEHLPQHTWCDVQALSVTWLGEAGQVLATGASDGVVRVWDVRAASPAARRFAPHSAPLLALTAGANEHQLLAASECGALLLLDERQTAQPVVASQVQASAPLTALSPLLAGGAAPLVGVGTADGTVAAVDPRDLAVISRRVVHAGPVGGLAWLAPPAAGSRGTLLSGGWDKRLVCLPLGSGADSAGKAA